MFEKRDVTAPKPGDFWVVWYHLPLAKAGAFYRKLDEPLDPDNTKAVWRFDNLLSKSDHLEEADLEHLEVNRRIDPGTSSRASLSKGGTEDLAKRREGRKTSNENRINPHDPDAKVGRTKDGACDMVYKPEHLTDLETGVII